MSFIDTVSLIKEFSEKIETLVSEADWELLNTVLLQRQRVLEQFFSSVDQSEIRPVNIINLIEQIQVKDELLLANIKGQKKELEKQCLILKKGRQSVKSYQ